MKKVRVSRTDIEILLSAVLFVIALVLIFGTAGRIETDPRPAPEVIIRFFAFILLFGIDTVWIRILDRRKKNEIHMHDMQERMDQRQGQRREAL